MSAPENPRGSGSGRPAYPSQQQQQQQQAAEMPQQGMSAGRESLIGLYIPEGLAATQYANTSPAYAQHLTAAQVNGRASLVMDPLVTATILSSNSTSNNGQRTQAGSLVNLALSDPPVPGQESAGPTYALSPVSPASNSIPIPHQSVYKPTSPFASHPSTFPPLSALSDHNHLPTYDQLRAAQPQAPITGLPSPLVIKVLGQTGPLKKSEPPASAPPTFTPLSPTLRAVYLSNVLKNMGPHPDSVTRLVIRGLERCMLEGDVPMMMAGLILKLQTAKEGGQMFEIDWDTEPTPSLPSDYKNPPARKRMLWTGGLAEDNTPLVPGKRGEAGVGAEDNNNNNNNNNSNGNEMLENEAAPAPAKKQKAKAANVEARSGGRAIKSIPTPAHLLLDSAATKPVKGYFAAEAAARKRRRQQNGEPEPKASHASSGGGRKSCRSKGGKSSGKDEPETSLTNIAFTGTCSVLEKPYVRPSPVLDYTLVRSESVLQVAYERLLSILASGLATYDYTLSQLKAMRQDLTVQRIFNHLAVLIYEMSARVALVNGDIPEYTQCQTHLHTILYPIEGSGGCRAEFYAYLLLFKTIYIRMGRSYALLHSMEHVTPELAATQEVSHALQVRQAIMNNSYSKLFRLYSTATGLGRALMDEVIPSVRWGALNTITKSFQGLLPVSMLAEMLGFMPDLSEPDLRDCEEDCAWDDECDEVLLPGCTHAGFVGRFAAADSETEGMAACVQWLIAHGAVIIETDALEPMIDAKLSAGQLQMPEDETKAAPQDDDLQLEIS